MLRVAQQIVQCLPAEEAGKCIVTTLLDVFNRPIPGFSDLTSCDLDLSKLTESSIRVRVDITSELNTTSPWLDRLTVTWIDRMSWMDRFYGTARVDGLVGMTVGEGVRSVPLSPTSIGAQGGAGYVYVLESHDGATSAKGRYRAGLDATNGQTLFSWTQRQSTMGTIGNR